MGEIVNASERTLIVMRHAKSSYPDGVGDHDRPLAARGQREAGLAGQWLRDHLPPVDQVLCSSATRTRETLGLINMGAPTEYLDQLYGATPGMLISEVNRVDDAIGTLLVVGHEPTVSQVSLGLANPNGSNRTALSELSMKFPTSGMAVLLVSGGWANLQLGSARLVSFHVPR